MTKLRETTLDWYLSQLLEQSKCNNKYDTCWSLDLIEVLSDIKHPFFAFVVFDNLNETLIWNEVDTAWSAEDIIRDLVMITAWRGFPQHISTCCGEPFNSSTFAKWANQHQIQHLVRTNRNPNSHDKLLKIYSEELFENHRELLQPVKKDRKRKKQITPKQEIEIIIERIEKRREEIRSALNTLKFGESGQTLEVGKLSGTKLTPISGPNIDSLHGIYL